MALQSVAAVAAHLTILPPNLRTSSRNSHARTEFQAPGRADAASCRGLTARGENRSLLLAARRRSHRSGCVDLPKRRKRVSRVVPARFETIRGCALPRDRRAAQAGRRNRTVSQEWLLVQHSL